MRKSRWWEKALRSQPARRMAPPRRLERQLLALIRGKTKLRALHFFHVTASSSGATTITVGSGRVLARDRQGGACAARTRQELAEYLAGRRAYFSVPVDLTRLAGFQRLVLEATRRIPFGETRSYGWLAGKIGHPGAARAVGAALGANPLPILVPCHRVTRSDGSLGGYALGLALKQRLLRLEKETPVLVGCTTTRLLCRRGCPRERRIGQANRVAFASVAQARRLGYRPCAVCRPRDRRPG